MMKIIGHTPRLDQNRSNRSALPASLDWPNLPQRLNPEPAPFQLEPSQRLAEANRRIKAPMAAMDFYLRSIFGIEFGSRTTLFRSEAEGAAIFFGCSTVVTERSRLTSAVPRFQSGQSDTVAAVLVTKVQ
jgi:hypothetical protein